MNRINMRASLLYENKTNQKNKTIFTTTHLSLFELKVRFSATTTSCRRHCLQAFIARAISFARALHHTSRTRLDTGGIATLAVLFVHTVAALRTHFDTRRFATFALRQFVQIKAPLTVVFALARLGLGFARAGAVRLDTVCFARLTQCDTLVFTFHDNGV